MIPAFKDQSGKDPKVFIRGEEIEQQHSSILSLEKPVKSVFQQFDNIVSNVQGAKECKDNRSQSGYINYTCAPKIHTHNTQLKGLRVRDAALVGPQQLNI